jgi:hypothetical protein
MDFKDTYLEKGGPWWGPNLDLTTGRISLPRPTLSTVPCTNQQLLSSSPPGSSASPRRGWPWASSGWLSEQPLSMCWYKPIDHMTIFVSSTYQAALRRRLFLSFLSLTLLRVDRYTPHVSLRRFACAKSLPGFASSPVSTPFGGLGQPEVSFPVEASKAPPCYVRGQRQRFSRFSKPPTLLFYLWRFFCRSLFHRRLFSSLAHLRQLYFFD